MHFKNNFDLSVCVGDRIRSIESIPDPIVRTRIRLGWLDRLRVLFGSPLELQIKPTNKTAMDDMMRALEPHIWKSDVAESSGQ